MTDKPKPVARPYSESNAVITGGTAGVGLATALKLAALGVPRIALLGRNAERGEAARQTVLAQSPSTQVEFIQADANELEQARAAVDTVIAKFGGIDILVCSTIGLYTPNPLLQIPPEEIGPIMLATVMAPMLMARFSLQSMRERGGGVIINMASDAAKVPTPGETILGAAMSAIVLFSRTLAMEAKRFNVRVNVLTPSLIEGTATAARVQKEGFSAKLFATVASMAALGVATPEDLAEMIVFLVGPQAGKITGQTISVNGGISAG